MELQKYIREARHSDIPKLMAIGGWLVDDVMGLRQDRNKIRKLLMTAVTSNMHKLLVAEIDTMIVGAMLTLSEQFLFAEKMYAQIIGIYTCKQGVAEEMLKTTMAWVEQRKAIQAVTYSMIVATNTDKLLLKNDFKSTGSMLVWRRYGTL